MHKEDLGILFAAIGIVLTILVFGFSTILAVQLASRTPPVRPPACLTRTVSGAPQLLPATAAWPPDLRRETG